MITESSNPSLWTTLFNTYKAECTPGHITRGAEIYKVHILANGGVGFEKIEHMDYIDSRSLTNSRKASYSKLNE